MAKDDQPEGRITRPLLASSDILNLGNQTSLIELFPMAAYAVRAPDGVIAWFNSRAAELWGRVPTLGDTDERYCGAYKLFHADGTHMAHCDTPVALALETGASIHEQEVVIERPDGSRVTVSMYIDPIRDQDGAIAGVVNFFHDTYERKQAERTNGLLAAIVDSSDDAIVSKSLDGIITSWNKGAEQLFGYSAKEAIGQNIRLIVPQDRHHEEATILTLLARGERVDHFETVRVRKDGSMLDISVAISPVKDAAGAVIGASKVARDITERKLAARAQAEQARLLDLSTDAIFVRDMADRITYWSKGASELYGYTCDEALGRVTHELLRTVFPEPLENVRAQLDRADRWTGELVHKKKNGTEIVVTTRWVLDRDPYGNPRSILETNTDITQRKQAERAFKEKEFSARLLQLQDDERRRLARELHDGVGQLLAAMGMNAVKLCAEKSKLSPDTARCAEENAKLIEQASADIRTVSYLLHPPLLDEMGLHSALKWYIDGFAERSKIAANLELPIDFGRLPKDHEMCLFRLVQESLTNIHRHSGSSTAKVRLWRTPGEVKMEVSDDGRGIPQEIRSKIASGETAGVGFRGMQERVKQIGGTLGIHCNGKGTSVVVTLPLTEEAVSPEQAHSPKDQHGQSHQQTKPLIGHDQAV
ncbi:MAG TPA: PAS domain S-box protein [Candidatus Eisenbacteria bacterium]|nr:PAS domain S-box protein [Candidatus Eisenbacteria bacterium]